jgi:hypothetical protein
MIKQAALLTMMTIGMATSVMAEESVINTATAELFGAELYSFDTVQYGKFVFRARMLSAPGAVSSFFTYDNESWAGNEIPWRELDIEVVGSEPDLMQTNIITGHSADKVTSEDLSTVDNLNWFHTYTLEWTPDVVRWQVDGVTVRENFAEQSQQVVDLRGTPQTYRANLWVAEAVEWVGVFDESSLPMYQVFDWMEYYQWQNGEYQLSWRDDFDTMDDSRWGKGDWSFDTNLVTFAPENIDVIDGNLVLALTAGEKGIDVNDYQSQVNIVPVANLQFLQNGKFITAFDPSGTAVEILPAFEDGNGDAVFVDKVLVNDEELAADADNHYQIEAALLAESNQIEVFFHDDREPDSVHSISVELKQQASTADSPLFVGGCTYAGPGTGGDATLVILLMLSGLFFIKKLRSQ